MSRTRAANLMILAIHTRPACCTLAADIKDANALVGRLANSASLARCATLTDPGQQTTALIRSDAADIRQTKKRRGRNDQPGLGAAAAFGLLARSAAARRRRGACCRPNSLLRERSARSAERRRNSGDARAARAPDAAAADPTWRRRIWSALPRIVIDNVSPAVDRGRFAAKRVIGQAIAIEADVFTDGHELLAVETLWRAVDETNWRRVPMQHLGNDRWQSAILPDRIGRYQFTVEAWWDKYGTFCRDLDLKRQAGADITVDIAEGRELLKRAHARAQTNAGEVIASALNWLNDTSVESSADILLSRDLREVMRGAKSAPSCTSPRAAADARGRATASAVRLLVRAIPAFRDRSTRTDTARSTT